MGELYNTNIKTFAGNNNLYSQIPINSNEKAGERIIVIGLSFFDTHS